MLNVACFVFYFGGDFVVDASWVTCVHRAYGVRTHLLFGFYVFEYGFIRWGLRFMFLGVKVSLRLILVWFYWFSFVWVFRGLGLVLDWIAWGCFVVVVSFSVAGGFGGMGLCLVGWCLGWVLALGFFMLIMICFAWVCSPCIEISCGLDLEW